MGNASPRYTPEFKQRAVDLYRQSGTTYAEVARGLGIDAGSLSDWVKSADAADAAGGPQGVGDAQGHRDLVALDEIAANLRFRGAGLDGLLVRPHLRSNRSKCNTNAFRTIIAPVSLSMTVGELKGEH